MTILTALQANSGEKKEPEAKIDAEASTEIPLTGSTNLSNEATLGWYYALRRRRRLLTFLCSALLILWLLMAAIVGSILLFRYLHRRPVFYGWCGADYVDQNSPTPAKLQQRVEVDEDQEYERIDVPRFGPNRPATFVHDFRQNWTAIVDFLGGQCFVKPLDRRQIAPPANFIDLIRKAESGYYEQNTAVIRERYRVRVPPISASELEELGSWMIKDQCSRYITFMLEKTSRRHALERTRRSAKKCEQHHTFGFYNADDTVITQTIDEC